MKLLKVQRGDVSTVTQPNHLPPSALVKDLRLPVVLAGHTGTHHHLHSDLPTGGHLLPDRSPDAVEATSEIRGQTKHQRTAAGHRSGRLVPAHADRQERGRHQLPRHSRKTSTTTALFVRTQRTAATESGRRRSTAQELSLVRLSSWLNG